MDEQEWVAIIPYHIAGAMYFWYVLYGTIPGSRKYQLRAVKRNIWELKHVGKHFYYTWRGNGDRGEQRYAIENS